MPGVITNFAALSGNVPAAMLDEAFAEAGTLAALDAVAEDVALLPSSATPLVPVAGGAAGGDPTLSRSDHQHPPQSADQNFQTGTTVTATALMNGQVIDCANASAITFTLPDSLSAEVNFLVTQGGAGQITFVTSGGASMHQRQSLTKTAGQWAVVSVYVRTNAGSAAEYVLAGDMVL